MGKIVPCDRAEYVRESAPGQELAGDASLVEDKSANQGFIVGRDERIVLTLDYREWPTVSSEVAESELA